MRCNVLPIVLIANGAPPRPVPDAPLVAQTARLSAHRRDTGAGPVNANLMTAVNRCLDIRMEASWP